MTNSAAASASAGPSAIVPCGTGPEPVTSTCFRPGSCARIGATLRSYSCGLVTSTCASPSSIRSRIGSGPNAEKSGLNTLTFFSVPSAVDIEFRHPAEQGEHPVALADAETSQQVGEPVGLLPQVPVAVLGDFAVAAKTAQCHPVGPRPERVPVDGFVRDVQAPSRQAVERLPGLGPRELRAGALVVSQVEAPRGRRQLGDRFPPHDLGLSVAYPTRLAGAQWAG